MPHNIEHIVGTDIERQIRERIENTLDPLVIESRIESRLAGAAREFTPPNAKESGFEDIPINAWREAKDIASGLSRGGLLLFKNLFTKPIDTLAAAPGFIGQVIDLTIDDYIRLYNQPLVEIKERPLTTYLNILPFTGAISKFAAKAAGTSAARTFSEAAFHNISVVTSPAAPFKGAVKLVEAAPIIGKPVKILKREVAVTTALGLERMKALFGSGARKEEVIKLLEKHSPEALTAAVIGIRETASVNTASRLQSFTAASAGPQHFKSKIQDILDRYNIRNVPEAKQRLIDLDELIGEGRVERTVGFGTTFEAQFEAIALERRAIVDLLDNVYALDNYGTAEALAVRLKAEAHKITPEHVAAAEDLEKVLGMFPGILRATKELGPADEALRKIAAFAVASETPVEKVIPFFLDGTLSVDDFAYVPHIPFESKISALERGVKLFGPEDLKRTTSKKLSPKPPEIAALKEFQGKLEDFSRNPADFLMNHIEDMNRKVQFAQVLGNTLPKWVDEGIATPIADDVLLQYKALEKSPIGTRQQIGKFVGEVVDIDGRKEVRIMNPETGRRMALMDPKGFFQNDGLINEGILATLNGISEGKPVAEALDKVLKTITAGAPEDALMKYRRMVEMPKFLVDQVDAKRLMDSMGYQQIQRNAFVELFWDLPTRFWRANVLGLSPRWVIFNTMGNFVLNAVGGVKLVDYIDYLKPGSQYRKAIPGIVKHPAGYTKEAGMQVTDLSPAAAETVFGQVAQKTANLMPFRIIGKVRDTIVNINLGIEEGFRGIRATRGIKDQAKALRRTKKMAGDMMTVEESMHTVMAKLQDTFVGDFSDEALALLDVTDKTLFNYSRMSEIERAVVRRAIPFWSWYKNIATTTALLPINHPFKSAAMSWLGRNAVEEFDDTLPHWLRGSIPYGVADDGDMMFLSMRGMNPFIDVFHMRPSGVLNPIIKVGIERISGVDTFRQRPFRDPQIFQAYNGKTYRVDPDTNKLEEAKAVPPFYIHVLRQFPLAQLGEEFKTPGLRYDSSTPLDFQPIVDPQGRQIYPEGRGARQAWAFLTGRNISEYDIPGFKRGEEKRRKRILAKSFKSKREQELYKKRLEKEGDK